ncbi:T-lymphocyte surface antigen Ly-9-like [Pelobates fuscus]|uniref:T-lymphocyte surface antigen Ly-9-like n=1 Tax=Pelobates fuscus TaxID=191477 RepID=UPI002FE46B5C
MRQPSPPSCILLSLFILTAAQRNVLLPMPGLLYQSVCLSSDFNLTHPVEDASWTFQNNGEEIRIAKFPNSKFRVNNNNRFNNRLKPSNNMTGLTIRDLRPEDSGTYTVTITLTDGVTHRASFNLTVYEPVPVPEIKTELDIISPDWCNFTLYCSVPTITSTLSASWSYRYNVTEHHPFNETKYNKSHAVHLSLQSQSHNSQFLCLVQNPVDKKNVSVYTQQICPANRQNLPSTSDQGTPLHLNGLLSQAINLTSDLNVTQSVRDSFWYFTPSGRRKRRICEFRNDKTHPCDNSNDPRERFELYNDGMTLEIKSVMFEDSGIFELLVTLQDRTTETSLFNFTVYEPVPSPKINITLENVNADRCNITLYCFVMSSASMLSFVWKYGDQERESYGNGFRIELSLTPTESSMEYQCLVRNPVSQNMASVLPPQNCTITHIGQNRNKYYIMLSLMIIVFPLAVWFVVVTNRTTKEGEVSAQTGRTYYEVEDLRSQEKSNVQQAKNPPETAKAQTIYCVLQRDGE